MRDSDIDAGAAGLAEACGDDFITAMTRDPRCVFAYWEITPHGMEDARRRLGDEGARAKTILRVYGTGGADFTGEDHRDSFDIELAEAGQDPVAICGLGSRYIDTMQPGASFCVDVGLLGEQGGFSMIARSGIVRTPPEGVSPNAVDSAEPPDPAKEAWIAPVRAAGGGTGGPQSPGMERLMQEQLCMVLGSEAGGSPFGGSPVEGW